MHGPPGLFPLLHPVMSHRRGGPTPEPPFWADFGLVPVTALVVQKWVFGTLMGGGPRTAPRSPAAACPPPYRIACLRIVCGLAGVVLKLAGGAVNHQG